MKQSGVDDTSLALIRVEEEVTCLSDGAGTKDESNMGVQFKNSAPNSDGENDSDWGEVTQKRKSKRTKGPARRSTRIVKNKGVAQTQRL